MDRTDRTARGERRRLRLFAVGYRYEQADNLTQAKIYFRKAIDAGLVDCYQDLVRVHDKEGDSEGARRLYAEGIEADARPPGP